MDYTIEYVFSRDLTVRFLEFPTAQSVLEADAVARAHYKAFGAVGYRIREASTEKVLGGWDEGAAARASEDAGAP